MKTIILAFMLLALNQSNAQSLNIEPSVRKVDLLHTTGVLWTGTGGNNDTIRTIMIVADTSKFYSLTINTDGHKLFTIDSSGVYAVGILGYRVAGNIMMEILPNHHIIEHMKYLDRFKRPLPTSLVVLSFTDTK